MRMSRRSSVFVLAVAVVAALGLAACKKNVVTKGKAVKINYKLTVDGQVVDTSEGREPLTYVQGSGQIIPVLEEALEGAKVGDKKHVTIPPEKAYGLPNPNATQKVPRAAFGDMKDLKVGSVVTGQAGGRMMQAKVLAITPKEVTLDMNHPLAGKTLNFDVEVVGIEKAPKAPAMPGAPSSNPNTPPGDR